MPKSLGLIPQGVVIVDKDGAITDFFRLRWEELRSGFQTSPTAAALQKIGQTAALATTALLTTKSAGLYRISWYLRRTVNDGVSSSATVTLGWQESGVPLTEAQTPVTEAGTAEQSGSKLVWADGATDLSIAVAYASNTPGLMAYRLDTSVEQLQ